MWNVPSPVSSAILFVISSIGPLTWYIPKYFADIVVGIVGTELQPIKVKKPSIPVLDHAIFNELEQRMHMSAHGNLLPRLQTRDSFVISVIPTHLVSRSLGPCVRLKS
ncbi:unnamed protein product [Protopolystoma xenopodis]|uniref:Uncharacterized protein n=1 Tax=Protopolystoma xenopodis TaxID=117903 RepID=A0A3S4ZEX4_9PLAT|nr:unnamed protein product [Protopolystoma xenopodis]